MRSISISSNWCWISPSLGSLTLFAVLEFNLREVKAMKSYLERILEDWSRTRARGDLTPDPRASTFCSSVESLFESLIAAIDESRMFLIKPIRTPALPPGSLLRKVAWIQFWIYNLEVDPDPCSWSTHPRRPNKIKLSALSTIIAGRILRGNWVASSLVTLTLTDLRRMDFASDFLVRLGFNDDGPASPGANRILISLR